MPITICAVSKILSLMSEARTVAVYGVSYRSDEKGEGECPAIVNRLLHSASPQSKGRSKGRCLFASISVLGLYE